MTSLEIAKKAAEALEEKKGQEIKILKIEDLTVLTDYFVIGTGTSSTQIKALSNEVEFLLGKSGLQAKSREGYDSGGWILLDYGSVIVHVFQPSAREFYSLEKLWADAVVVE